MSVVFSFKLKELKRVSRIDNPVANTGFSLSGDNGAAVILTHGLTGTPFEMKYLANFLHRKGYTVICPRLANHGQPLNILKRSKWQDFYNSVRRVMAEDELAGFGGPIFVAGLSMGSLLSLILAEEFPDRIKGVSCLAPAMFYDGWNTPFSKMLLPLCYTTPLKHFFYYKEDPPYGIKNEAVQQRVRKYYNTAKLDNIEGVVQYGYPYFPVALLHELQLIVKEVIDRLPRIEVPIQTIQAKDDDMASIRNSKSIYDRVRSNNKEMVFLYDSYHVITADQERDIVAEKMEGFFSRILKGSR
jgi:carboxylesterase